MISFAMSTGREAHGEDLFTYLQLNTIDSSLLRGGRIVGLIDL